MAKKVKCPTCGAKNALDARRCRVCTGIINAEVAEVHRGMAVPKEQLGQEPVAAEAAADPAAGIEIPGADPVGGIDIDIPGVTPVDTAPPPPAAAAVDPAPEELEKFDPDQLFRDMGRG